MHLLNPNQIHGPHVTQDHFLCRVKLFWSRSFPFGLDSLLYAEKTVYSTFLPKAGGEQMDSCES